jgi:hypothetical protein
VQAELAYCIADGGEQPNDFVATVDRVWQQRAVSDSGWLMSLWEVDGRELLNADPSAIHPDGLTGDVGLVV